MFINVSNHPASRWSQDQIEAAQVLGGDIRDFPFPNVPADASSADVLDLSRDLVEDIFYEIGAGQGDVVMVQGEFSLTIATVERLRSYGIQCVVACSEREVVETVVDGETKKTSVFRFRRFREV
jgi:hypothetical protein